MSTLSWQLYSGGSEVIFQAAEADSGYVITVSRDGVSLMSESGLTGSSLLQRALELWRSFQKLGYSGIASTQGALLKGGLCWGPGAPLPASVLIATQASGPDYGDPQALLASGLGYELSLPTSAPTAARQEHSAAA